MIKGRRVGTLTLGVTLVGFGSLFLAHQFIPLITYRLIAGLWPAILILLGIETLVASAVNRREVMKYDAAAVVLIVCLSFFAMAMGGCEWAIAHAVPGGVISFR